MSTITKEFTNEQLIEQAKKNIEVLRGAVEKIPGASDAAVIHLKLAEITLASLEAEAVAWMVKDTDTGEKIIRSDRSCFEGSCQPLYAAPAAPVSVHDEATPENIEILASTYAPRGVTYQWDREECNAAADSRNACRAAMLKGAEPISQTCTLPNGYCVMPLKLTAENGAKGALSGEFHVTNRIVCQSCAGEGCEDCNDEGGWNAEIPVSWDTIKRIHESAVEACALPAAPQQEVKP